MRNSRKHGLLVCESTLAWWLRQDDEALKLLSNALDPAQAIDLDEALETFTEWFPTDARLWGNGANFDNTLLSAAYYTVDLATPWKFYNDRCFRTMKNVFDEVPAPEFQGTKHDALADALYQTRHLQAIFAHLKEVRQ